MAAAHKVSTMDDTDLMILDLLQENARMPVKDIAGKIGLGPSSTSERIRRLENKGIIQRYEARLDPDGLANGLTAFIYVRTNEMAGGERAADRLCAIPELQEVFSIAGEDCYLVKVRTRDTKSLSRLLREKIQPIDSVVSTRSIIVMESFKETCRFSLEHAGKNKGNKK